MQLHLESSHVIPKKEVSEAIHNVIHAHVLSYAICATEIICASNAKVSMFVLSNPYVRNELGNHCKCQRLCNQVSKQKKL